MSLAYLHVSVLLSARRVTHNMTNMGHFDINIPSLSPLFLACRTKKMMVVKYFSCIHMFTSFTYLKVAIIYITFLLPNHVDSLKFNVNSVPSGYNLIASVRGPGNDMCELHYSPVSYRRKLEFFCAG